MKEKYYVSHDYQGGSFGQDRELTIDEWREQALDWVDMDEYYELVEYIKSIHNEDLLDFMSEFWEIEFSRVIDS